MLFNKYNSCQKKNIWRYGVYNEDGSRAFIANPSFPIKSQYTSGDDTYEIFGWASHYGVHVDTWHLPSDVNVDVTTLDFKKEEFDFHNSDSDSSNSSNSDPLTYNVERITMRIEKIESSQISLNDLDKINLALYVGDYYFQSEYQALNAAFEMNKEYLGSFDKDTGIFTFTHELDFSSGYNETELNPAISFTTSDWISN